MSDLIDRQALLKQIDIDSDGEPGYYGDTWKFIDTIKSMPPTELSTNLAEVGTDTISRQDIIQRLEYVIAHGVPNKRGKHEMTAEAILEAVKQLPPAQSEPSQVAKDIARIVENGQDMRVIAQPEIIRCKDCKHWIPYDWMFSEVWRSRNINDYPEDEIGCNYCDMTMKANDFCSRGERKNDG